MPSKKRNRLLPFPGRSAHTLIQVVLFLAAMLALASPLAAQDAVDCAQLGDFRLTTDEILVMQENLVAMGLDPGIPDGLIGPNTRGGINQFCRLTRSLIDRSGNFEIELRDLIVAYGEVTEGRHKDNWRKILEDPAFQKWVDQDAERARRIRKSGTVDQINEVLDQWVALQQPGEPAAAPEAPVVPPPPPPPPPTIPELIHSIPTRSITPITWSAGKGCGCLRDFGRKVVYGFFPFWTEKPTALDFSLLSRIGYFAVPLDGDGITVLNSGHWKPTRAEFINVARRFNTAVDLVVYNDKWERWKRKDAAFVPRLAEQLAGMVMTPLSDSTLNRAVPYISMGQDPVPTMGDGVTLYLNFDSGLEDETERTAVLSNVAALVADLKKAINKDGEERKVNLLLQMHNFTGDARVFKLAEIQTALDEADLVLVSVDETDVEASKAKKILRSEVEAQFGEAVEERSVLRKLIPVIAPGGQAGAVEKEENLANNLAYFEDNFGGIGFLPAPTATDTALNRRVINEFVDNSNDPLRPYIPLARSDSALCLIVCPNGWVFLGVFRSLLLIGIAAGVLWLSLADARIFFAKWPRLFWVWLSGVLLIGAAIYLCDDSFQGNRDEYLVLFILGTIVFLWVRRVYKKREADYP